MTTATRFKVQGTVQGVGYRAYVARNAKALGLTGWVRNEPDGTVEAVVEGEPENIAEMEELMRAGPRGATVSGVDATPQPPLGLEGFAIRK